jgi:hypothetical protein
MTRAMFAALAGALIVFVSSAILHMATPLGRLGVSALPNEAATLQAMRETIPGSGLYLFSGTQSGPHGLLAYTAGAAPPIAPRELAMEFLSVLAAALVAVFFLTLLRNGTLLRRASLVALLAVFGWLSITASHWIWYRFPAAFVLAALTVEVIAWFLAGLAMAKIVR